jgi:PleD family two-component response regulator
MPEAISQLLTNKKLAVGNEILTNELHYSTILYIDDEYVNYLYLSELLAETGATFHRVYSAGQAINFLISNKTISLVIVSATFAEKTGNEIIRVIKEINPSLPVIIILWDSSTKKEITSMEAGSDLILSGFIDKSNLLEALSELIVSH